MVVCQIHSEEPLFPLPASAENDENNDHHPDAITFVRQHLQFEPDEIQAQVLRSGAHRGILNCTRQWGKSTLTAALTVHHACTHPDSMVLVASPGARQSGEFLAKASRMLRNMGMVAKGDGHNALSLLFPNGSRIVGIPGNEATVRGFSSVSLMVIDEAARVPDELYHALLPMLAVSDGALWLLSTPHGRSGFFHDVWEYGGDAWLRVSVNALDCPRISRRFLEEERATKDSAWFAQEYLCRFMGSEGRFFPKELLDAAIDRTVRPLFPMREALA